MTNSRKRLVLPLPLALVAAGLALAGCSGGGGMFAMTSPTPQPSPRLEDQLGANFGAAFRQATSAEPTDPAVGDLGAVSLATEPLEVN